MSDQTTTRLIQAHLDRLHAGDAGARDGLIGVACERLRRLTRRMLGDFPGVRRWEETDDVLSEAVLRLCRALEDVCPATAREFLGLAALQVRRELCDLARRFRGPEGFAAHHASGAAGGSRAGPRRRRPTRPTNPTGWRPGPSSTASSRPCRRRSARSSTCCGIRD